jgi:uncharacterized membrane protein
MIFVFFLSQLNCCSRSTLWCIIFLFYESATLTRLAFCLFLIKIFLGLPFFVNCSSRTHSCFVMKYVYSLLYLSLRWKRVNTKVMTNPYCMHSYGYYIFVGFPKFLAQHNHDITVLTVCLYMVVSRICALAVVWIQPFDSISDVHGWNLQNFFFILEGFCISLTEIDPSRNL